MRSGLSSSLRRVALASCAGVLVAVPATATGTTDQLQPLRRGAGDPAVAQFRVSRELVRAADASSLRFVWRVRNPRTLALVLNRWEGGEWAPAATYVGGRYRGSAGPALVSGARSLAQLVPAPPPGKWRATLWASVGEADGGPGSVNRMLEFEILPDERG